MKIYYYFCRWICGRCRSVWGLKPKNKKKNKEEQNGILVDWPIIMKMKKKNCHFGFEWIKVRNMFISYNCLSANSLITRRKSKTIINHHHLQINTTLLCQLFAATNGWPIYSFYRQPTNKDEQCYAVYASWSCCCIMIEIEDVCNQLIPPLLLIIGPSSLTYNSHPLVAHN